MFTKEDCLISLSANGCRLVGRNHWTDGTYLFRIAGGKDGYRIVADRITPAPDANEAVRSALRPMFRASRH